MLSSDTPEGFRLTGIICRNAVIGVVIGGGRTGATRSESGTCGTGYIWMVIGLGAGTVIGCGTGVMGTCRSGSKGTVIGSGAEGGIAGGEAPASAWMIVDASLGYRQCQLLNTLSNLVLALSRHPSCASYLHGPDRVFVCRRRRYSPFYVIDSSPCRELSDTSYRLL